MKMSGDWEAGSLTDITRDFVPFPSIILLGCTPLVPGRPTGDCPTCGGMIGKPRKPDLSGDKPTLVVEPLDHKTYCGRCDALSPANERRVHNASRGGNSQEKAAEAARDAERDLAKKAKKTELSEVARRRLWNGYGGGLLEPRSKVTNRAKIGRDFLININQLPRWNLILDSHGKVIGEKPKEPHAESPQEAPDDEFVATT